MLEIAAFKVGSGYAFTADQRAHYLAALDNTAAPNLAGQTLSEYLGEFLLVKCFFFLAPKRPADPAARPDKP